MGGTGPPRGSPRADPGAARTQLVRVAQGYVSYWLRGFGASGLRGFGASGELTERNRGRDPTHICTSSVLPRLEEIPAGVHRCPVRRSLDHSVPKSQTTSPKTPQIHSISPKWSALWAHPSPTPPIWRQQQGLRGLPQCPWAAEPGWTSETTRRAKLAARTASGRADPHQSPRPHRSGGRRRVQRAGWPDNEPTRPATHSDTAPPVWRAPEGPEGTGSRTRRHLEY